jgi:mannose-1-phosphate guanylyltransferase
MIWATALPGLLTQNTQGNVQDGDVFCQNSNNNHIKGGDRLVAAIGVENLVLVDTSDAPLVAQSNHVE